MLPELLSIHLNNEDTLRLLQPTICTTLSLSYVVCSINSKTKEKEVSMHHVITEIKVESLKCSAHLQDVKF